MGLFSKPKGDVCDKVFSKFPEILGSGNFADVYKAKLNETKSERRTYTKNKTSMQYPKDGLVAIKVIDKAKVEDMQDIEREISIMEDLSHKHIIELYEVFQEPKKVNLVMELVTGGELFDRIVAKGNYTEADAAECIFMVCDALEYLHEKKIVHRDLKPENLLYKTSDPDNENYNQIKIADFGLARPLADGGQMMKTACGTPGYVAPEILQNKGYDNTAVDMWSVGVILYILLCGFPPFYEEELPALFDSILKARYDFPSPWWDNIQKESKDLVRQLLQVKIPNRATATQVKDSAFCTAIRKKTDLAQLASTQKALKKYHATQKLRKAAMGIIAQQRFQKALKALHDAANA